ncbi:MAG TPA: hypothetical protein VMM93_01400 [Vicinamibacterales bacterium]|nr:hypothetical protein [Vicinamibacterales bacterium]
MRLFGRIRRAGLATEPLPVGPSEHVRLVGDLEARSRALFGRALAIRHVDAGFGLVEGWRGRVTHMVMTGEDGRLRRVKIVDPSFFNWPALARALDQNIVPDFPLINKSFNQSYSGNDL